jgi:Uma2 family endonuclease
MTPAHAGVTESLRRQLGDVTPAAWYVREDKPIRIPGWTEPLPDLAVVSGDYRSYLVRHPEPADIALIVEISKARIRLNWIVNPVDRQVEICTEPAEGGYGAEQVYKPGEDVPVTIDGDEVGRIAVSEILQGECTI